jgi:hypothetical protein
MKNVFLFFISSLFMMLSCGKDDNKKKCDDCLATNYSCDREGGEIRWTVNGQNEIKTSGYITANQGGTNNIYNTFSFSGNFSNCIEDIQGSTKSSKFEFEVGEYDLYYMSVWITDFCGSETVVGNEGFIEVESYDGKNASGIFGIYERTPGATQCKPDWWEIEGTFTNVPVY